MQNTDFYGENTSAIPRYFGNTILGIMNTKKQNSKTILLNIETLYRLTFVFVLEVIEYSDLLKKKDKHSIANNLLDSACIMGELIHETREINEPFKLNQKITQSKLEAKKVKYWLNLCKYSKNYPSPKNLIAEIDELTHLLSEITSKPTFYNKNKSELSIKPENR